MDSSPVTSTHTGALALAVDVDGTLLSTDLLWESAAAYLMTTPRAPIDMMRWLARGRQTLKAELAARVPLEVATLPYAAPVVAYVDEARRRGSRVILATAAARPYAEAVAAHLGGFEAVLATDERLGNLRSERKADAIDAYFEGEPWAYIGDSSNDEPVWRRATAVVTAGASASTRAATERMGKPVTHIEGVERSSTARAWTRQLRLHQWTKNVLVIVPLLAAQAWDDAAAVTGALLGFLAFGLVASSVYVWNDLSDLATDRAHPIKSGRPLAAGRVSIPAAIVVATVMAVGAAVLGAVVGWLFLLTLAVYAAVTTAYTVFLKRKIVADVVTLALLYTWRIVAGAAAIMIVPSIWILAFSTFLFLSLSLMKRYTEFINHESDARGRGYEPGDVAVLLSAGPAAGLIAALVLVMYTNSPQVAAQYAHPYVLWALVPLLVYWIVRAWLLAGRGHMDDDPILFAVRDRNSRITIALAGIVMAVAIFF